MTPRVDAALNRILIALAALLAAGDIVLLVRAKYYLTTPGSIVLYGALAPLAVIGLVLARRLTAERKAAVLLLVCSTWGGLYLLQGLLLVTSEMKLRKSGTFQEYVRSKGLEFDSRTPSEVLKDMRAAGRDVSLHFGPTFITSTEGIKTKKGKIYPLGGMTRREVIFCNEFGKYVLYETDEHGFRNPPGLYEGKGVDAALLGDSFAEGQCVGDGEDIASHLRAVYPRTLNFGQAGTGALLQAAIWKEYVEPLQPKIVLWTFFSNDLAEDMSAEFKNPFLRRYLGDFSQDLLHRRQDVDAAWRSFYTEAAKIVKKAAVPPVTESLFGWAQHRAMQKALRCLRFYYLLTYVDGRYALSVYERRKLEAFLDRFEEMARETESWGGKMYFVYLPENVFFFNRRAADRFRTDVLAGVRERGIPVIDIHEVFAASADPTSYYFMNRSTHYNAEGYAVVAETILKELRQGGKAP